MMSICTLLTLQAIITLCYATESVPALRIMTIGDSITIGRSGGYRKILWDNLVSRNYTVQFVGSEDDKVDLFLNHEGHEGWTIHQLSEHFAQILDQVPDPDIILLLIGNEDFVQGDDVDNAIRRWDNLIKRLAELRPFTRIFAANLLPHKNSDISNSIANKFNRFAQKIVRDHVVAKVKITYVNMASVIKADDLGDDSLPNEKGYQKIATQWIKAMRRKFGRFGDGNPPGIIRAKGWLDSHHVSVTFSKPINPESANPDNFMIEKLYIQNATLASDNRSIILKTSKQDHGVTYKIIVLTGVKDIKNRELPSYSSITFTPGWRFLVLSDWHSAEKYVFRYYIEDIENDVKVLQHLKKVYGGDLIMIAGDTNSGKWYKEDFREKLSTATGKSLSSNDAVIEAGDRCYSGMYSSFRSAGYWNLLMSFGDHEAGDNPWTQNSLKSHLQPKYRETFAKSFNHDYNNKFIYLNPIGAASSRPIGTIFEETSFAYINNNVLFVSIDVFFQKSPFKELDGRNTVAGRINGDHLKWFDFVLAEGRKQEQVKHIFVAGHFPVLYPVRKVKSSGQYMNWREHSLFWKTMRANKVDLYFAGEVHLTTVTKDPISNLIQITSRGNYFTSFLSVDVTDDAIDITCHNEIGNKPIMYNYNYETSGRLIVKKTSKSNNTETTIESYGELSLLNTSAPMIHFDFEQIVPLQSRKVHGLGDIEGTNNVPAANSVPVNGVICKQSIPNKGEFGQNYDAQSTNVKLVDGVHGNAGKFSSTSRAAVWAMGPHAGGHIVSYALWFQTTSMAEVILVSYEAIWNKPTVLNLRLNNGSIELCQSANQKLLSTNSVELLNDGEWHHIAMSMPYKDCQLSEILLYVDGEQIETRVDGVDESVYYPNGGVLALGGFGYGGIKSKSSFIRQGFRKGSPFIGYMDDVIIWTRTLSSFEIQNLWDSR